MQPALSGFPDARLVARDARTVWVHAWSADPAATGAGAELLVTHDAASTWSVVQHPCAAQGGVRDEQLSLTLDGRQLWLRCAPQPPALFTSRDDGQHWSAVPWTGISELAGSLRMLSERRGFWGQPSAGGALLGTDDGGQTWQLAFQDRLAGAVGPISFVDALHGWAVTDAHGIGLAGLWRTQDGGLHWDRVAVP